MQTSSIAESLAAIRSTLPADGSVELVAVSKFHPAEAVLAAYEAGQRVFGESRVQELLEKQAALADAAPDIRWHFIGHLQTNKVRALVGRVHMIESIDSERLLSLVDAESLRAGVVSRVLLQVHVAREDTKFGFTPSEIEDYFAAARFESLRAVHICGLMAMASNTDDAARVRADFEAVAALRRRILDAAPGLRGFDVLSMGMSDDYPLAVAAGSTHIRIGSAIFGPRS